MTINISMLCRVGLLRWQLLRTIWVLMKIWIFCNHGYGKMDWVELFIIIISLRAETETKFWVRRVVSRKCYKYFSCVEDGKAIPRGMGISGNCVLCAWNEASIKNGTQKDVKYTHHMYLLAYILYILDQLLLLNDFSLFWTIVQGICFVLDFNPWGLSISQDKWDSVEFHFVFAITEDLLTLPKPSVLFLGAKILHRSCWEKRKEVRQTHSMRNPPWNTGSDTFPGSQSWELQWAALGNINIITRKAHKR